MRFRTNAGLATVLLMLMALLPVLGAPIALGTQPEPEHKVRICHRTNSASNPYTSNVVDYSAVDGSGGNDHSSHTGPVFDPAIHDQQNRGWGDIIPPIPDVIDAGLNWTEAGKAIWNNGCQLPTEPGDTTPTSDPDYPTSTSEPDTSTSTSEPDDSIPDTPAPEDTTPTTPTSEPTTGTEREQATTTSTEPEEVLGESTTTTTPPGDQPDDEPGDEPETEGETTDTLPFTGIDSDGMAMAAALALAAGGGLLLLTRGSAQRGAHLRR